jgi:hypothetical protein
VSRRVAHIIDGKVVTVSVRQEGDDRPAADGSTLVDLPFTTDTDGVRHHTGGIGWDYVGGTFVDNRPKLDD